jgi:hypothetical protein
MANSTVTTPERANIVKMVGKKSYTPAAKEAIILSRKLGSAELSRIMDDVKVVLDEQSLFAFMNALILEFRIRERSSMFEKYPKYVNVLRFSCREALRLIESLAVQLEYPGCEVGVKDLTTLDGEWISVRVLKKRRSKCGRKRESKKFAASER